MVDEQPARDEQPTQKQPGAEPAEPDPADGTAVLPQTDQPESPARWAARAGVPARGPRAAAPEQQWVPEQAPRIWWTPILIGLAILVLLGLVGLGLWLAVRGSTPVPGPSPTPGVSTTSAAPTTAPPTTAASPPTVLVPVPPLANVPADQAVDILRTQGLTANVVTRVSDSLPAGTVIDTNPPAGTKVPVGSVVTLFVAAPPATSAPPTPTPDGSG